MKIKLKNILMISFLAVAGIFGISSALINEEVDQNNIVEKAEAASPSTKDGVVTIQIDSTDNFGTGYAKIWAWFSNASSGCWATTQVNYDDHCFYTSGNGNIKRYYVVPSDSSQVWTKLTMPRTRSDWVNPGWSGDGFWGQSADISLTSDCNSYYFSGSYHWDGTKKTNIYDFNGQVVSFDCFSGGAPYYFECNNIDWKISYRNIYAHFYDPIDSSGTYEDIQLHAIESTYKDGTSTTTNYGIHECSPSKTYWRVIYYRATSAGGTYDNQTSNLMATSNNVFKLTNMNGSGSLNWNLSDSDRLEIFGRYITEQTDGSGLCDGNSASGDHSTALSTKWNNIKSQYNGMASSLQTQVKNAVAASQAKYLKAGLIRYDYIAYKYQSGCATPLENFISRSIPSKGAMKLFSPLSLFGTEEDMSTTIVIVASSVALLSITALSILVIKKRKNKEE